MLPVHETEVIPVFRDATDDEAKSRLKDLVRRFLQLAPETVAKGA
jgi:hypothetical protein